MRKTHLLIIDPQNDFCDLPANMLAQVDGLTSRPALAVPGAHQDMKRLSAFLYASYEKIDGITVTMDSHPFLAIERTSFWTDRDGNQVVPFTSISAESVKRGEFTPAFNRDLVIERLQALEAGGQHHLIAWPVHCVTGTWGHNIHATVAARLNVWEMRTGNTARKVLKGEYPWSEHYGAFEAETPVTTVPSTQFNEDLARSVTQGVDLLLVAGEASSHCVAASVMQLLKALKGERITARPNFRIALLTDCMSPVPGFEAQAQAFFAQAKEEGVLFTTSREATHLITE